MGIVFSASRVLYFVLCCGTSIVCFVRHCIVLWTVGIVLLSRGFVMQWCRCLSVGYVLYRAVVRSSLWLLYVLFVAVETAFS